MIGAPPMGGPDPAGGALAVLRNRPFLLLWLSQVATQIGANMVLFGLTVIVLEATSRNSAVSALFLTFLVPAVLLSAVAGVFVDRMDRRTILVVTNVLRAGAFILIFLAGPNLAAILLLNIFVSVVTVFFAPAEAAMIPTLVPRKQLVSANGLFTLTLNGAFALGFALLGPLMVSIAGPSFLLLFVVVLYLIAAVFCFTLPSSPPVAQPGPPRGALSSLGEAEKAVETTLGQLREGIVYIRANPAISWSLFYLGIAASLVGVIGVLGPNFARETLGLQPKDLVVVVLPLGLGIVTGILILNSYGKYMSRRRAIEGGLISLGVLLIVLTVAGPISRFLSAAAAVETGGAVDPGALTTLVAVVVALAFVAGIAYGVVAISSQTQLQEDIPHEVRGRVFGVLNMLVSVSSFLPIIIVGPIADEVGTTGVILVVAAFIVLSGVASIVRRGPLRPEESAAMAGTMVPGTAVDAIGVAMRTSESDPESGDDGGADADREDSADDHAPDADAAADEAEAGDGEPDAPATADRPDA